MRPWPGTRSKILYPFTFCVITLTHSVQAVYLALKKTCKAFHDITMNDVIFLSETTYFTEYFAFLCRFLFNLERYISNMNRKGVPVAPWWKIVLLVTAVLVRHHFVRGVITLDADRGYIDVLVAIDDNVDENNFPDLLDTIEQEFTLASSRLHIATRYTFYVGQIVKNHLPNSRRWSYTGCSKKAERSIFVTLKFENTAYFDSSDKTLPSEKNDIKFIWFWFGNINDSTTISWNTVL